MAGYRTAILFNPNFNTSGYEMLSELGCFVPVLGELLAITEFADDERKDISKLFDAAGSVITEDSIAKITPIADTLDSVGKVLDIINVFNFFETLSNWKSPDKIATEVNIYVQMGQEESYQYHAIVHNNMMFQELWSGYINIAMIEPEERDFQIILE